MTVTAGGSQTTRFERFTFQASGFAGGIDFSSVLGVKVGRNTYEMTGLEYHTKTVGPGHEEIVGVAVVRGTFEQVGPDLIQGQGTGAYYLASQDADQDGFPDEGQEPMLCVPWEWTTKRVTMMPGCVPTSEQGGQ